MKTVRKCALTALVLLGLTLSSCQNAIMYTPEFLIDSTMRFEVGSRTWFVYDENRCQYSCNTQRREYSVFTDNMSSFYSVTLDRIPSEVDETIIAQELLWTDSKGVQIRKRLSLKVVQITQTDVWLWNGTDGIRFILPLE